MANPIIKIKRGATAPVATLNAGEFAIDQAAKNLYLGVEVGGVVTNEIVGGEGTFATKTYVDSAVSAGTGSLGTMSTQDADSVAITGGTIGGTAITGGTIDGTALTGGTIDGTAIGATTPSTGKFTKVEVSNTSGEINVFSNQTQFGWGIAGVGSNPLYVTSTLDLSIGSGIIEAGGFGAVRGLGEPANDNDAARKKYVDDKVSALGSVFHYVGDVSAYTDASNPFELANIVDQSTGAYYRVDVAGTYTAGSGPSMEAKVGDAFVKTSTGWQKLDNVDAVVSGTLGEIVVTGDENLGYTVAIAQPFKDLVQNIDPAGTIAGTTHINGALVLGDSTFATVAGSSLGLDIKDGADLQLHVGKWYGRAGIVGYTDDMAIQAKNKLVLIGTSNGFPAKAQEIQLDSIVVKGSADGTTTLEDFVIDGGVY
jgi:hypothetical protein